ncbi:MAG: hypothetical protein RBT41_05725 [Clostridia bacterium]|nr:hypothetical protein [Clostridia bacterium]
MAYNLSGAVEAALAGRFVVLVDVIDMSTTAEALLEAGASKIWGAAPCGKGEPYANPYLIGREAAQEARKNQRRVFVIAEPRVGQPEERNKRAALVLDGIRAEGAEPADIFPNLGAETAKFTDWRNHYAVIVSDAGGTVFDAVWQLGGGITTATVARTLGMKGPASAHKGVERALLMAQGAPVTVTAASGSALEDVLAAQYIAQLLLAAVAD